MRWQALLLLLMLPLLVAADAEWRGPAVSQGLCNRWAGASSIDDLVIDARGHMITVQSTPNVATGGAGPGSGAWVVLVYTCLEDEPGASLNTCLQADDSFDSTPVLAESFPGTRGRAWAPAGFVKFNQIVAPTFGEIPELVVCKVYN